jgi:hypothetical protein
MFVVNNGVQLQSWDGRLFVSLVQTRGLTPTAAIRLTFAVAGGAGSSPIPNFPKGALPAAPRLTLAPGELRNGFGFGRALLTVSTASMFVQVRVFAVPYWVVVVLPLTLAATALWRRSRRARARRQAGLCVHCGYDLRATPARCPECGTVVVTDRVTPGIEAVAADASVD